MFVIQGDTGIQLQGVLMLRFGILGMDWGSDMWAELYSHNPSQHMKVVVHMLSPPKTVATQDMLQLGTGYL